MISCVRLRSAAVVGVALLAIVGIGTGTAVAGADEFFETSIRPILAEKCQKCHGDDKARGGLSLAGRESLLRGGDSGPAAVPGKPGESLLIAAVERRGELKMPPKEALSRGEIDRLARWIELGVPWPKAPAAATTGAADRWWSFRPVRSPSPPAVSDPTWPRTEVDRFILAALEARELKPSATADRRTLIRRATFDLTGLPPTPEEVEAFLADRSPDAFARVVDRLLASPSYGERWARHWLDVVRYADARDLIQLPAGSDFREAWRYRDWVVGAFNRDMSYAEFVRYQVAGDLLPPTRPGGINPDAIVATGFLAIADFVPGDVDKDQMIADYVDDQVDVVGKAFLGLTLACARCHDHKFDPISAQDYYALAGIFFSTSLVPGPVPGNTPLVRVPLLSADEIARLRAQDAADRRRRAALEQQLPDADDRAYIAQLERPITGGTARYLVAACEYRFPVVGATKVSLEELARQRGLHPAWLAGWVEFLGRVGEQPSLGRHPTLRDAAAGKLTGPALARAAGELEQALAALASRRDAEAARAAEAGDLAGACVLRFRADDPYLVADPESRVTLWPNRSGLPADARPPAGAAGPVRAAVAIDGRAKVVLRFDGRSLLEAPRPVPASGSLFAVFRTADDAGPGRRLLGWEDSDVGKHGLGLIAEPGGRLQAILRNDGQAGDLVDGRPAAGFEVVGLTWGPDGTALRRNGTLVQSQKGIDAVSADPGIAALRLGGPGSGNSPRFRGDLAELRVYNRQLDDPGCKRVDGELRRAWLEPADASPPARDPLAELLDELRSARGPFWTLAEERRKRLPPEHRARQDALAHELEVLKKKPAPRSPRRSPCRTAARRARATRASRTLRSSCAGTTRGPARPCRGASRAS